MMISLMCLGVIVIGLALVAKHYMTGLGLEYGSDREKPPFRASNTPSQAPS
jgi:hypothetical protein